MRISSILIKAILRSFSCVSVMSPFSEPTVVGLLGSSGDRLPWLLFFYEKTVNLDTIAGLVLVGWLFYSLVSVALSGS